MEMIHVAYMWRVSRQSLMMTDVNPLADPAPPPAAAPAGPAPAGASPSKKVKDQMDDTFQEGHAEAVEDKVVVAWRTARSKHWERLAGRCFVQSSSC